MKTNQKMKTTNQKEKPKKNKNPNKTKSNQPKNEKPKKQTCQSIVKIETHMKRKPPTLGCEGTP